MSLNGTPRGERVHIAVFGKRNAGKSSLINAMTGQMTAVVSAVKGTTTDPVYKAMELLPLGPVVLIDTPGLDDEGELGQLRVEKAMEILHKTDIAILVLNGEDVDEVRFTEEGLDESFALEKGLEKLLKEKGIPLVWVMNKADTLGDRGGFTGAGKCFEEMTFVSAKTGEGIHELKERLSVWREKEEPERQLVGDLVEPADLVVLVVPIDNAAPKGRLILPQQQTIRDLLEAEAVAVVTKETMLKETFMGLKKNPKLVITDSQAFAKVAKDTPKEVFLTSFSILFARYKGDLETLVKGVRAVEALKDGDMVLMAEGCTHHRQCSDIGTVKIPRWLTEYTGKKLVFETSSGTGFPSDLKQYSIIVHCGGCMLNEREMKHRMQKADQESVPIVNYGILIAYIKGLLKRSLEPFPAISNLLDT